MKKSFGPGSLSSVLLVLAILIGWEFPTGYSLGDEIYNFLGLKPWSEGGFHNTTYLLVLLFIAGWLLGKKYPQDYGAVNGKYFSGVMLFAMTSAIVLFSF